jgi:hypothetical protein
MCVDLITIACIFLVYRQADERVVDLAKVEMAELQELSASLAKDQRLKKLRLHKSGPEIILYDR